MSKNNVEGKTKNEENLLKYASSHCSVYKAGEHWNEKNRDYFHFFYKLLFQEGWGLPCLNFWQESLDLFLDILLVLVSPGAHLMLIYY